MGTKSRSFATSIITKTILFIIVVIFTFYGIYSAGVFVDTVRNNNLPFESMGVMRWQDSWQVDRFEQELCRALFYKEKPQLDIDPLPAFDYRVEYPDGSTVSNAPAYNGDQYFTSRKVYAILHTNPDGSWTQEQRSGNSIYTHAYDVLNKGAIAQSFEQERRQASSSTTDVTAATDEDVADKITVDVTEYYLYSNGSDSRITTGWSVENPCPTVRISFAFNDASLDATETFWQQCRYYYINQFVLLGGMLLALVICAMWLLITCGRKPADRELHLLTVDRVPTEIMLALTGLCGVSGIALCVVLLDQINYQNSYSVYSDKLLFNLIAGGITMLAALALLGVMSLLRLIKAHRFIRNSIIFRILRWCWTPFGKLFDMAKGCFDERAFKDSPLTLALQKRQKVFLATLMAVLLFCILLSFVFLGMDGGGSALLMAIVILVMAPVTYWHIKGNRTTYLEINKGFDDSLEEQMKSERTKTALITNVSHDLKTPLTSIITYVDLLEKEELSDTARDYVTVLAQKSQRLKAMVSDLFDLSKSSSGNIPLELETLDLKRLLEQTLADMRDHIEASSLILKTAFPSDEVYVYSDGKKLYRVFQNVIDNALKYSLDGTRVFITLERDNGKAVATIKSTSANEMNFTADEVLQRFSRGDEARTGEGSGLGLSIAQSFTVACGGDFKLAIDGDLFKVTASFPIVKKPEEPSPQPAAAPVPEPTPAFIEPTPAATEAAPAPGEEQPETVSSSPEEDSKNV